MPNTVTKKESIKRTYGNIRNFGNVFWNENSKSFFMTLSFGVLGKQSFNLVKNGDNTFSITKEIKDKNGNSVSLNFGKLFPVKKDGNIIEGRYSGSLGIYNKFDKELGKSVTAYNDCIFITMYKTEQVKYPETNLVKVAYISGQFVIEVNEYNKEKTTENIEVQLPEISDEEIPF